MEQRPQPPPQKTWRFHSNIRQLVLMFCLISVCLVKATFSSVHEILANSTSKPKTNIWSSKGQISRPVIAFAIVFHILVTELFINLTYGVWPEPDWGYRKSNMPSLQNGYIYSTGRHQTSCDLVDDRLVKIVVLHYPDTVYLSCIINCHLDIIECELD